MLNVDHWKKKCRDWRRAGIHWNSAPVQGNEGTDTVYFFAESLIKTVADHMIFYVVNCFTIYVVMVGCTTTLTIHMQQSWLYCP